MTAQGSAFGYVTPRHIFIDYRTRFSYRWRMPPNQNARQNGLAASRAACNRPRTQRDFERMQRARAAAQAERKSAMATALAEIESAFDEAAAINAFKMRIEQMLRLGVGHPAIRARFAARAALLSGRSLDASTFAVDAWWRDERKAFQIASIFGRSTRLSLEVLRELRLILRLLRFKRMEAQYALILAALSEAPAAIAAE